MTGRQELDDDNIKRIERKLKGLPQYMTDYYYSLESKTAATSYRYISKVATFLNYIKKEFDIDVDNERNLANIKPLMISRYLKDEIKGEGCAKATVYYAIRNFFRFVVANDIILVNPTDKVEAPRDTKMHEITYLTPGEIRLIASRIEMNLGESDSIKLTYTTRRNLAIFYMLVFTGLRVSSVVGLNVEDIDFEKNQIRIVEKGNKTRYIKMSGVLADTLKKYMDGWFYKKFKDETNVLFMSINGSRMHQQDVYRMLKNYTSDFDKKISPHKLRSTYATTAIKKTKNIYLVSKQLGHSDVKTTSRYAAIDDEMQQEAASVMDDILG